jgi:surface protein
MPTNINSFSSSFAGLHAVFPSGSNYVVFTITTTGQYQVNWGDGTTTLHNTNTAASYSYDYNTYDTGNLTLSSRGYKQAMVTVTPVSASAHFGTFNLQNRFVTTPAQNNIYSTGFLDCILSMPSAIAGTSIVIGGSTVGHRYIERFEIKTIGGCTSLSALFQNCTSLQSVPLFNTSNVTAMNNMFVTCTSLITAPNFNTSNVTNMTGMFNECSALRTVPLYDTSKVTTINVMFRGCRALQSVPLFNTSNVTTMNGMLSSCGSIETVPFFDTSKVTNMGGMFEGCSRLKELPLYNTSLVTDLTAFIGSCINLTYIPYFDTSKVITWNNAMVGCSSLKEIPALSTAALNITGSAMNSFSSNPSLERCQMSFKTGVTVAQNRLSRTALVEIFNNLADRTSTTAAGITITGNFGASALTAGDRLIATNKNWTITG